MWKEVKRVLKPNGAFITTSSQPFTSALIMSNPSWFKDEIIWDKVNATGSQTSKIKVMVRHENIVIFGRAKITYNPIMQEAKPENIRPKNKGTVSHKEIAPMGSGVHRGANDYDVTKRYPNSIYTLSKFTAECNPARKIRLHPTQKPVALYEYLIRTYTNEGETVLDICFGSCTTGIACLNTNRKFIGIEKDDAIFFVGSERIKAKEAGLLGTPFSCDMIGTMKLDYQANSLLPYFQKSDKV